MDITILVLPIVNSPFPKISLPPVIIHVNVGFSLNSTIQLLGKIHHQSTPWFLHYHITILPYYHITILLYYYIAITLTHG